ncbi:MAG: DUF2680 domain-containing protein [Caulobacteraceae bacterium]
MKKTFLVVVLALALVFTTISAFADDTQSILSKVTGLSDDEITTLRAQGIGYGQLIPASIIAGRTNLDIKDVIALRQAGKTYYQIAVDKGIEAADYKNDLIEKKSAYVDEQVKAGTLTEEQGNLIKDRLETNIESCNGQTPGTGRINGGCGIGFGGGMGRLGNGIGRGFGRTGNIQ